MAAPVVISKDQIESIIRKSIVLRDRPDIRNLNEAIKGFRSVSDVSYWAKKELVAALLIRGDPNDHTEIASLLEELVKHDDVNSTVRLAIACRDGTFVSKDVERALELLKKVANRSLWAKQQLVETALKERMPDVLDCIDCHDYPQYNKALPYTATIDKSCKGLTVITSGLEDGQPRLYTLYRNWVKVESVQSSCNRMTFHADECGLYYVSIKVGPDSFNTLSLRIGSEENRRELPAQVIRRDYYKLNYPYVDFSVIASETKLDLSLLNESFDVKEQIVGDLHVYVMTGEPMIKGSGGTEHLFSGETIIDGRFIYGSRDLTSGCYSKLNDSVGDYAHISKSKSKIVVETDLFGITKLFSFEDGTIKVVSNRYHLLLIILKNLGRKCEVDTDTLLASLYTSSGLISEQTISEDMIARGTKLLDPGTRIVIDKAGFHYRDNGLKRMIVDAGSSNYDYDLMLEQAKKELLSNIKAILESPHFRNVIVDISGGFDSRLVLALVDAVDSWKNVYVDTSGENRDEIRCGSAVAEAVGIGYNYDYIAYRKISGGYGLECPGSLTVDDYLGLVSSIDLGDYDSSFLQTIRFDDSIHLCGRSGELMTRPSIIHRILRMGKKTYNSPSSLVDRHIPSRSPSTVLGYEDAGARYATRLERVMSRYWDSGNNHKVLSIEQLSLVSRARFHDDFCKDSSFSTPSWSPLLSKQTYLANINTMDKFDSNKFSYDLIKAINPSLSEYEYEDPLSNFERTVLLKDCLNDESGRMFGIDEPTDDYMASNLKSVESHSMIDGEYYTKLALPSHALYEKVIERTEYLINRLEDVCLSKEVANQLRSFLLFLATSKDRKRLISLYKKVDSAVAVIDIFNSDDKTALNVVTYSPLIYSDKV